MIDRRYTYLIGIDCGVNTGFATYFRPDKKLWFVDCFKLHQALFRIYNLNSSEDYRGRIFIRVEDARLRKWIPQGKNEKDERGRREGAGSVKRDAIIWEEFLTDNCIPFEMVAPKNNTTKLDSKKFSQYTGYQKSTNQHGRDAAMLVFGY